jgi:long-chain acyl-CoA synthetase|uniref:Acyl-CoA synthetase n=1 Tax=Candidatus Actinomarina minuta TaxID=1389454 RepID=S5DL19_9ACTN|nr:long-chain acyl-CoA synthetases (AMP-forming) [Candidatus Actinomarina minuta]
MLTMENIFNEIRENGGSTPCRKVNEIAMRFPDKVAFRDKRFGIWSEISYQSFWEQAQWVGCALNYFGVDSFNKVAVHSENRPEWIIADIGIQSIRAISVGLYPTNPPSEVKYLLEHSETKVLFAEDQEQVDKALEVMNELPNLKKIIYFEDRGVVGYKDEILMSWEEFLAIGKKEYEKNKDFVISRMEEIESGDVACLIYTSGTTGPPKGSMISHGNLEWCGSIIPKLSFTPGISNPEFLSYLPICHIFGRLIDIIIAIHVMGTINFAESIDTVQRDLAEVQPSMFPAVPRILERMHAGTLVRMKDASRLKKALFEIASKLGNFSANRRLEYGDKDLLAKITNFVAQVICFRALKKKLGLLNVDNAVSGAAPIAPEILKFFMNMGVPIYEGYGMTENSAVATGNKPGSVKLGTVGVPQPDVEIKLADDGEILVRHPGVFLGYYKNEEATKETIDKEGWLYTGDVGAYDGKFLKIIDRKKDIIITSGGKNVSPSEIENNLKTSPYIKEAIVIGDDRKFLSALVGIEYDIVSNWALRKNIPHTTYRNLSENEEVNNLIWDEIKKANDRTSSLSIRKFRMITKELDHEDGDLTATQKAKRNVIMEKFSDLIEEMYK